MTPNWFIGFPMQVERLQLGTPPARVRVFHKDDLHCTLAFLGAVGRVAATRAWEIADDLVEGRWVNGTFGSVRPLGNPRAPSALSAIIEEGVHPLASMTLQTRGPCLTAAGAPADDRRPLPHVTVARIQRKANARERRDAVAWARSIDLEGVTFLAGEVALYTWSEDRRERLFQIAERRALASPPD